MPFDGVVTYAMVDELNKKAVGGRIDKIYQPTDTELIVSFRNNRKNYDLLLSIHPIYARFHLTKEKFVNPKSPPMFCMLLRKHLLGSYIQKIEQYSFERIVKIQLQCRDEIGDLTMKTLLIEVMGRHSNIILLNKENKKIIDCMKHIKPFQNRYRTVLPGYDYVYPPSQNKTNPLEIKYDDFSKKLDFNKGKMDRQIVNNLMGFSPFLAKEITYTAHLGDSNQYNEAFLTIKNQIKNKKWQPAVYQNKKDDFHVLPLHYLERKTKPFSTISEMLDYFYIGKAESERIKQQAQNLLRFVKNELDKNNRKLKKHIKKLQRAKDADYYQKQGELLTAHMHEVKKGDLNVKVLDYYDPEQKEITIELDPQKTPSENAQSFFKTYQKLKNATRYLKNEIQKTKLENAYFEQLIQQIELARKEDLVEIREELIEEGYIRKRKKDRQRKKRKIQPELFYATDKTPIYVGRNNKQNDFLTTKFAHKNDIWLHTKDVPGSHVIIRGKDPSEKTITEAAHLAAFYSRAKNSSNVAVDYTYVRYVNKPRGAKPGFVTYDQHQTVYVTPQKEVIEQLKTSKANQ